MNISKTSRIVGFTVFAVLIISAVIVLWPIILPFFLGIIFAYLLQPAVKRIKDMDVESSAAVIIVYAYFYLLQLAVISLCAPILSTQFKSLFDLLPQLLNQATAAITDALDGVSSFVFRDLLDRLAYSAIEAIPSKAIDAMYDTTTMLSQLLRASFYTVLIPFISFYYLRDNSAARCRIASILPVKGRNELLRLVGDIDHLFRQYVQGYMLVSITVAMLSTIFYWSIGLDYAMALGAFMGLADIIPYFGPFIGAVPSIAVALSIDLDLAVLTAFGLVIIQQIESLVITPKIIGNRVGIHPLTTIFVVLAGGWLFGLLGAVLAVPVAAAGLLVIRYFWSVFVGAKIE